MFNSIHLYRIAHRCYKLRLFFLSRVIEVIIQLVYCCRIPSACRIGEGTHLSYGGIGLVIHPDTTIGKNCRILPHVTIGGKSGSKGAPLIGDNVLIGSGARILGPVAIGDGAKIGANAVVLINVPPYATAVGVPARIIKPAGVDVGEDI
jgi:serine O-acetyltransferase